MVRRQRRPSRVPLLRWNEETQEHLARHGIDTDQALDVARGQPVLVEQRGRYKDQADGTQRWQPPRLKMIGPDRRGDLITFVIEYLDLHGVSKIVSGWDASDHEAAQYDQRLGNTNV